MQITFTISDEKISEFKSAFLQIYPVPEDTNENQWIKRCIKRMIFSVYEQGKQQIFFEQNKPVYDENIIKD